MKQLKTIKINQTFDGYTIQDDMLVVPVVAVVEGVLNGEFVSISEFDPSKWEGIPLPVYHPQDSFGNYLHFETSGEDSMGEMKDVRIVDKKMLANLYLQKSKLENYPEVAQALETGKLEVSTGYDAYIKEESGVYNNKPYNGIQYNLIPDHLALLPKAVGACSWKDGCGAPRFNQGESMNKVRMNNWSEEAIKNNLLNESEPEADKRSLTANEMSFDDIRRNLYKALETAAVSDNVYDLWIADVFDDYFVYEDASGDLFRQNYARTEQGVVFVNEPAKAMLVKTYVTYTTNQNHTPEKGTFSMEKAKMVGLIINCKKNNFSEEDKEFLLGLEEAQLEKFVVEEEPTSVGNVSQQMEESLTSSDVQTIVANALKDFGQNLAKPASKEEIAEIVFNTMRKTQEDQEKDDLVSIITNTADNKLSKETLETLPLDALKNLAKDLDIEESVYMGGPVGVQNDEDLAVPPSIVLAANKTKEGE
jgi:hypothetical protein